MWSRLLAHVLAMSLHVKVIMDRQQLGSSYEVQTIRVSPQDLRDYYTDRVVDRYQVCLQWLHLVTFYHGLSS
jgi:hypothetical protein